MKLTDTRLLLIVLNLLLMIRYGEYGVGDGGERAYGQPEQGGGEHQERGGELGGGQRWWGS
jgi:hypothetical protein